MRDDGGACLLSLDDPRARDRAVAGGKASVLARLKALGLAVPPGVVLPAGVEVGAGVLEALRNALGELRPSGGALAVRSSVYAEDGAEASLAGQFLTVLNVRGDTALAEALRAVRASVAGHSSFVESVYHATCAPCPRCPGTEGTEGTKGTEGSKGSCPVLIQQQVAPRWAGVCFTADPASGMEHLTVIEAVPGLADGLVGGRVEPVYVRLDRRSERLVAMRNLPPDGDARAQVLRLADEVSALAERAREALGGEPLDVEWAWDGARLWLLQARPVTSPTFRVPARVPLGEPEVWHHGNFIETMPGPAPRLAFDAINELLADGPLLAPITSREVAREVGAACVEVLAGRVCWNASFLAYWGLLNPRSLLLMRMVDARTAEAIARLYAEGHLAPLRQPSARQQGRLFVGALWFRLATLGNTLRAWRQGRRGTLADMAASVRALLERAGTGPVAGMPPEEAWRQARVLLGGFWPALKRHTGVFDMLMFSLGYGLLAERWDRQAGGVGVAPLDAEPNWARRMEEDLRALGEALRAAGVTEGAAPEALAAVAGAHRNDHGRDARGTGVPARDVAPEALPAGVRPQFERFLSEYGHRGPREQDLTQPRLAEQPALVVELALRAAATPHRGGKREAELVEALLARIASRGVGGRLRAAVLRWLRLRAREWAPLREDAKHVFWMPVWQRVRQLVLGVGAGLRARGWIERPEDVFHFTCAELDALCEGALEARAGAAALAQARRREFARWQRVEFPEVLRSDGEPVAAAAEPGAGAWRGVGVSGGVYEGVARVARSFEEARALRPGEVLVVAALDPGWAPLFCRAGALVMEVGGVLSHGAVVARELGLPAVVGMVHATRVITSGQRVRVDGHLGRVEAAPGSATAGQDRDSA